MSNRICKNCGVELDMDLEVCPLCNDIAPTDKRGKNKGESAYPSELLQMNMRERKKYAWELTGIICASAIIVSIIVDLVLSKKLSWSLYCVITITALWNTLSLIIFAARRVVLITSGLLLNLLGMLVLIDLVDSPVNWFVPLGMPVTVAFVLLLTMILLLIRKANFRGFNILAMVLTSISVLCIVIEVFADIFAYARVEIGWSAITASVIIPFSAILMFMHYRLKRGKDLKSFFHI